MVSQENSYNEDAVCPVCSGGGSLFRVFGEHRLFRCSDCASLFYWPCDLADPGIHEEFWESEKAYVERCANLHFYAEIIQYVHEILNLRPRVENDGGVDFLEVGGSYGFLTDMARVGRHWRVAAVDPSECARKGAEALDFNLFNERIEDAPIDGTFDVIVAVQVIEHLRDLEAFVRSLCRLVRDDGIVVLTTPDGTLDDLGAEYHPSGHAALFSPEGLQLLLSRCGLEHCQVAKPSLTQMMVAVASKRKAPFDLRNIVNPSVRERAKSLLTNYLQDRSQDEEISALVSSGLSFRLFEILVNDGRYSRAQEVADSLERLMGAPDNAPSVEFLMEVAKEMSATSAPEEYVVAGPCFCAPYLLYKGILDLNHHRDYARAVRYLGMASELFEHETGNLGMIQYEPFKEAAQRNVDIAHAKAFETTPLRQTVRHGYIAPFSEAAVYREGVETLGADAEQARQRPIKLSGGDSLRFSFECRRNALSGLALGIVIRPKRMTSKIEFTLEIAAEDRPEMSRSAGFTVQPVAPEYSRVKAYHAAEVFQFEPILESKDTLFSVTLKICRRVRHAHVMAYVKDGAVSQAGDVVLQNVQPAVAPYHVRHAPPSVSFGKEAPLVSVLVVTYNSERFIRQCLDSVFRQKYPNVEAVVVDNCSSDGTVETVRQLFPEARLFVTESNLHFAKGNNFGAAKCRGDYICLLNPDAELEPDAIRMLACALESSPHVGAVGGLIDTRGSRSRYADAFLTHGLITPGYVNYLRSGQRFCAAPCGALFMTRRTVVEELGELFDEDFSADWEDHDLGLRCWLRGYSCLHLGRLAARHEGAGAFGVRNLSRDGRAIRNTLLSYYKNFERSNFFKSLVKIALQCYTPSRMWGLIRFLSCFRRFEPARRSIQRDRRISDTFLQLLASGLPARIGEPDRSCAPFGITQKERR